MYSKLNLVYQNMIVKLTVEPNYIMVGFLVAFITTTIINIIVITVVIFIIHFKSDAEHKLPYRCIEFFMYSCFAVPGLFLITWPVIYAIYSYKMSFSWLILAPSSYSLKKFSLNFSEWKVYFVFGWLGFYLH